MRAWWVAAFALGLVGACATGISHDEDLGTDAARSDLGLHDAGGPTDLGPHDATTSDLGATDAAPSDLAVDARTDAPPADLGVDARDADFGLDAPPPVDLGVDAGTVTPATWGTSATDHACPATLGMRFRYTCPAGGAAGSLWGTGTYTSDSSICTAAVHSGHITFATGGAITVEMRAGASSYRASTQHGVSSSSYGTWACSYAIVEPGCVAGSASCEADVCNDTTSDAMNCGGCGIPCAAPHVCAASSCGCAPGFTDCGGTCVDTTSDPAHCGGCAPCGPGLFCTAGICGGTPATWSTSATSHSCPTDVGTSFTYVCPAGGPTGTAWGTDTYTHDSSICTAAVHVGRITTAAGGSVTIQMAAGASSYTGSTRNGVTTSSYGAWSCSYTIP